MTVLNLNKYFKTSQIKGLLWKRNLSSAKFQGGLSMQSSLSISTVRKKAILLLFSHFTGFN